MIVASPDTDVLVCLVNHFNRWIYSGLNETRMLCGQGYAKRYVAVHDIVMSIPQELSDVLPAVHSLTGCNTTSKISSKNNAIKTVTKDYYHPLTEFGKSDMDDRLNNNTEEYLVHCFSKCASNDESFNDVILCIIKKFPDGR